MNQIVLLALIQALTQEVNLLEQELAQLQNPVAVTSTYTPPPLDIAPNIGAGTGTDNQTQIQTNIQTTMPATQTISVSFNATDTVGYVTVANTSNVAVRIKSLDVDGIFNGITIGKDYNEGMNYAPSFKDNMGHTFEVLACNGLGSEGLAILPGTGGVDPCLRKDANLARNELQPGETAILQYTGSPTGVTYQATSIVEVATGNDVQF